MIYPMRTIVAGIAEPDAEDPILAEVVDLAGRSGAHLHLVHAFELPSLAWDAYGRMGYVDPETIERFSESSRERIERAVAEVGDGVPMTVHAVPAPPATAIREVAKAEHADLVVVGATRRGAVGRLLLGTTAQRVVRGAEVPVLVLREPLAKPCRRILVTTDLSPFSAGVHELGLDVVESICDERCPEVRSLLVVGTSVPLPPPFPADHLREMAHTELEKFVEARRDRGDGRPVGVVRFGDPAEEIVAEVDEWQPDLVVLGTHSRPTTERWLLGSVAEAAVRSVRSNALVIPAKAEEQRELPVPRTDETSLAAPTNPN